MEKIYTATDRAQELGFDSLLAYLDFVTKSTISREFDETEPVYARIEKQRWIADCKDGTCRGCNYVDPEDNWFFCGSCLNFSVGGKLRRVVFPENYKEIEEELLKREVTLPPGAFGTQGARIADGLPRSWNPGESIEDLIAQREGWKAVTKEQLMNEYSLALERVKELEAALAAKEEGDGV